MKRHISTVCLMVAAAVATPAVSSPHDRALGTPRFQSDERDLSRDQALRIQFRWLDRVPSPDERALFLRAAAAWSDRIRSYGPPFANGVRLPAQLVLLYPEILGSRPRYLPPQFTPIHGGLAVAPDVDLLILVDDSWSPSISTAHPHAWTVDPGTGAFRPWLGVLSLTDAGRRDLRTIVHEIGHVLGIGTSPVYHRLVSVEGDRETAFHGPHAFAFHGSPVPLEKYHPAPCPSVMSYRSCAGDAPSALDWAMLRDLGYELLAQ